MAKANTITTMADLCKASMFNTDDGFDCTMFSAQDVAEIVRQSHPKQELIRVTPIKGDGCRIKFCDHSTLWVSAWAVYADEV